MANQPSLDIPSLLHEALECLNNSKTERSQTLALISIAMSLAAPQPFIEHHAHNHNDLAEQVAEAADRFFTKPDGDAFGVLQKALYEWKTKKLQENA